jgi:hypothetical protein
VGTWNAEAEWASKRTKAQATRDSCSGVKFVRFASAAAATAATTVSEGVPSLASNQMAAAKD